MRDSSLRFAKTCLQYPFAFLSDTSAFKKKKKKAMEITVPNILQFLCKLDIEFQDVSSKRPKILLNY